MERNPKIYSKFLFFTILLLLPAFSLFATHQRAGEISYVYVSGLTYEFTIVTYTYTPSPADRPEIEIVWGDGTTSTVQRFRKLNLGNDISKNIYITRHTFPAAGNYHVSFEDPNRNAGIVNIPSSVEIPFFIETMVVINPFIGGNSSPVLENPPIDNGCTNVIYCHNPGAYDPDGDSLSYSLVNCRGLDGEEIPGYTLPAASNSITIDPMTGELVWDSPATAGEYNVAILIQEWRNGILISSIIRDMQITIAPCNNRPPVIEAQDTCVLAGTPLQIPVRISDSTSTMVTLSASGELLHLADSPLSFGSVMDSVPYNVELNWQTMCEHVRKTPYTLLLKAQDNGPQVELATFKTLRVRVVAPAPQNLLAQPVNNSIVLHWQPDSCENAVGYDVYRRNGSNPFEPGYCETGMPAGAGYYKIGTTSGWASTSFVDDGTARPLYHANDYCYRVVALFADGAESYVSDEACAAIVNDAPLIVNADVVTTDSLNGTIKVRWLRPPQIDTLAFHPPYFYELYRILPSDSDTLLLLWTTADVQSEVPEEYLDHDLNTANRDYTYNVRFLNEETLLESSDSATSIFLSLTPGDRKMHLSWSVQQPWVNVDYTVYRKDDMNEGWDSVATISNTAYTDSGLENDRMYGYYICARGYYMTNDTIGPLLNRSQSSFAMPYDNEPPEMPSLEVSTDCEMVTLKWNFDSDSAASENYLYYIYYKPSETAAFSCVDSFMATEACIGAQCEYLLRDIETVVGCFALKAADQNRNMSELSNVVCLDVYDCLEYRFPNVFTPNGDGFNDRFEPFLPYYGVVKVDMQIYNRWGRRVFTTSAPAIQWDGTDENTGQPCSEGVYYYGCKVFVNTLTGEHSYLLNGSVTLLR